MSKDTRTQQERLHEHAAVKPDTQKEEQQRRTPTVREVLFGRKTGKR